MKELIFLSPVLKDAVWGGKRLKTEFGYQQAGEQTGECWGISAHPNGDCMVHSCRYEGMTLSQLWKNHRELFGNNQQEKFPLLIKLIDAKDDLSIQVHPDDDYAARQENGSLGKNECWLVLDCTENGTIIIGTNAKDRQEVRHLIEQQRYQDLLREIPIKPGDFFQIDAGCIHAIKKDTLILEVQQNSDITYRIYDYQRTYQGKQRELHVDKGLDVIQAPYRQPSNAPQVRQEGDAIITHYITNSYYMVTGYQIHGTVILPEKKQFLNAVILQGQGTVNGKKVKKGDWFLIPAKYGTCEIKGDLWLVLATCM